MNKRASNNVTRNVKSEAVKVEAEALKVEAEKAEAEAVKVEAEAAEVQKAEAEQASSAVDVTKVEAEAAEVQEAAEVLKSTAVEMSKALDGEILPPSSKSTAEQLEEIKRKRAALAAEKAELQRKRESELAALKEQKALEAELKAFEQEQEALEAEKGKTAEELLAESEKVALDHDAWESAFAEGNNKLAAEYQDKLFIAALEASGNSVEQIKTVREYWKKQSSNFRAINSDNTMKGEKKQKAIMRRTLNRLIEQKRVLKEGMRLFINQNWKAEDVKTNK
jgi:hypothetical protein